MPSAEHSGRDLSAATLVSLHT